MYLILMYHFDALFPTPSPPPPPKKKDLFAPQKNFFGKTIDITFIYLF